MDWYVYIVRCGDGSLYTGVTSDVSRRVDEHNPGAGHGTPVPTCPWCSRRRGAPGPGQRPWQRELALKRLDRSAKLRLIEDRAPFRGAPYAVDASQRAAGMTKYTQGHASSQVGIYAARAVLRPAVHIL